MKTKIEEAMKHLESQEAAARANFVRELRKLATFATDSANRLENSTAVPTNLDVPNRVEGDLNRLLGIFEQLNDQRRCLEWLSKSAEEVVS